MIDRDKPQLKIGLLWHSFSSDNLGVGALSESQIAICERAAGEAGVSLRFVVFGTVGSRSYVPSGHSIEQGTEISLKKILLGRSSFFDELAQCDLVLDIGEGDSFADIYGKRRFRLQIATKIAVLFKGKPLVLSPQTIGPFDKPVSRWIAGQVMQRCRAVFARDGLSREYLHELALDDHAYESIDVAFRLPFECLVRETAGRPRIGLNVSGLLFSGGYAGSNQFSLSFDYPALIRCLLDKWTADAGVEVWLIPHVLADRVPRDDDRVAMQQLQSEYPSVRIAPEFASPSAAKSFISSMDFLTGARMHACIAALSSGVPVVPVAYSRKFNGLFSSLGYPWLADGKRMTLEQASQCIFDGFSRRQELAEAVALALEVVEQKLAVYESHLAALFRNLTGQAGDSPLAIKRKDLS